MRDSLRGSGWLWVAALAAVLVWSGLGGYVADRLDPVLPAPWRRVLLGLVVALAALALYFRSHWASTLGLLQRKGPADVQLARRLHETARDIDRSAHVIADNLAEIDGEGSRAGLYLEGARAHANKLTEMAARIRGVADEVRGDDD